MSQKYFYAVRCGHPAIGEVHCKGCTELARAGRRKFMGTFHTLTHALQSARLQYPDCVICQLCALLQR